MNLSERLTAAMQHKGTTNKSEVARAGGVTASAISQILTGHTKTLKSSTALLIAEFCGVSARWLSDGVGQMLPDGAGAAAPSAASSPESSIVDELVARGWSIEALADLCGVKPKLLRSCQSSTTLVASTSVMKLVDLYRAGFTAAEIRRVLELQERQLGGGS